MITRENYEIYLMDYLEGTLPEKERAEVKAFLLVHPDLQELLEGMEEVRLEVPKEVYGKKELLKRVVAGKELEYFAIAAAENVLTDEERDWVAENVEEAGFLREVETYRELKVHPDPACRFEEKVRLYRQPKVILFIKRYTAVAAVVTLAIVVAVYSSKKEEFTMKEMPVAVVKSETVILPDIPEQPVIVRPVIDAVQQMEGEREEAEETTVERIIPVDMIELKREVNVPVEIMAPQPSEVLVSPYEGVQLHLKVKVPRERSLEIISEMQESDNIVNNLIDAGKNVLGIIRNRDKKDASSL